MQTDIFFFKNFNLAEVEFQLEFASLLLKHVKLLLKYGLVEKVVTLLHESRTLITLSQQRQAMPPDQSARHLARIYDTLMVLQHNLNEARLTTIDLLKRAKCELGWTTMIYNL